MKTLNQKKLINNNEIVCSSNKVIRINLKFPIDLTLNELPPIPSSSTTTFIHIPSNKVKVMIATSVIFQEVLNKFVQRKEEEEAKSFTIKIYVGNREGERKPTGRRNVVYNAKV